MEDATFRSVWCDECEDAWSCRPFAADQVPCCPMCASDDTEAYGAAE